MICIFQFVYMYITLIDLGILKNTCILVIKLHLIVVYDSFNVLLDSVY